MLTGLANEKQLSSCVTEVRAKPEHHKFLIGRQGANIQSVRDKTGARIIFPGENDTDREVIVIMGTKESVALAKKELEARIKDLVSCSGLLLSAKLGNFEVHLIAVVVCLFSVSGHFHYIWAEHQMTKLNGILEA